MKIKHSLLLCLFLVLLGCSFQNSSFINLQGKWTAAGDIDDDGHSWYLEYTIKGNRYNITGYPPLSESGTLHLKETKGDSLLVQFRVIKSDPRYDDHDEWICLKGNQMMINSITFTRSIESKSE